MSILRHTELEMQYAQLAQPGNCPEGVYLSASDSLDRWNGVIFVRRGYYQGCILRFTVEFPAQYPHRAPVVAFEKGSIVHPLVDPTNDCLSLTSAFPSWSAEKDNITHVLFFIKGIFKTTNLDNLNEGFAKNSEAWRLYHFNRPVFAKLAAQCAAVSSSTSTLQGRTAHGSDSKKPAEGASSWEEQQHERHQGRPGTISFPSLSDEEMTKVRYAIFDR